MNPEQRPTPETDEAAYEDPTPGFAVVSYDFARQLERERDEARTQADNLAKELEAIRGERDQLSRELSSLLAGDCLDGHDAVEGVRNGIAMREAIKGAYSFIADRKEEGDFGIEMEPEYEVALAKLKRYLKP